MNQMNLERVRRQKRWRKKRGRKRKMRDGVGGEEEHESQGQAKPGSPETLLMETKIKFTGIDLLSLHS